MHLRLRLLSIGSYSLPFFPTCVPLSFSFPSFYSLWVLLLFLQFLQIKGLVGYLKFFCLFQVGLYCYELPLRTAFAVAHTFWIVVSSFSFVSRNFLISSLISFFTHSLINSMLFSLQVFECFGFFVLDIFFLVSVPYGQRKFLI